MIPHYLYIPELKKIKYPTADSPPLTIRHLLTHGAGFPEDNPWGDRQLADTDKDFIDFYQQTNFVFQSSGIAYEYSNLGFAMLGKIITVVSGQPYQEYIRKNIWLPLGMNTSEWEYGNIAPISWPTGTAGSTKNGTKKLYCMMSPVVHGERWQHDFIN
jgi:CubicO group peptidase (beta-lactamase class C family)